jgi:hypothetical protein
VRKSVLIFLLAVVTATSPLITATVSGQTRPGEIGYHDSSAGGFIKSMLVPLDNFVSLSDLRPTVLGDRIVDSAAVAPVPEDQPTSENGEYNDVRPIVSSGRTPFIVMGETKINDVRYAELLIFSRWTDSLGRTHAQDSVIVLTSDRHDSPLNMLDRGDVISSMRSVIGAPYRSTASGSVPYVIITSRDLAPAFEPLRNYRTACGYTAEIELIEDILGAYTGRDSAEQLRNYLRTFYSQGGRYVLLGGDGHVVPIRYAYPFPSSTVPDLRDQLVCDLYFADMTGEWDVDSDGVWGERYEDQPDATPELSVGRLPVDSPDEVAAFISKLIRYETNPGDGDLSYLTRSLFYSSDQMRDYADGGQHGKIAASFPSEFQIDTVIGVESLSGGDPNPTNTGPLELPTATRSGFGIVNVIAHGRFDGFVLKSSGYNQSPKQYVLTRGYGSIQCAFDSVGRESSPSFYYSLACDNGGFDLDRPPFATDGVNMGRDLLGSTRGAVAFVANSRWGWVGSSYFLHKAFFDSLFAHPDDPAINAMYRSQQAMWYYRDLVYGQVFLGDPLTRIYTSLPRKLTVAAKDSSGHCVATVLSPRGRESSIALTLSDSTGILELGTTSGDGSVTFSTLLVLGHTYTVTARGSGTTIGQIALTPSITTDIAGGQSSTPLDFALHQNYPNPFNPTTVISFDLPKNTRVTLTVVNLLGQEIDRPVEQQLLPAGSHLIEWNGHDRNGRPVASGVYFYRLTCDEFTDVRKLALVR